MSPALPSACISPCPCPVLQHPWEVQSGASTFLSVPIYSGMHRKEDKGCPLHTGGERRKKKHDSGEKYVIQGAHSFSSVLPTGMGVSLVPLSSLPSSVPCQQSQTSHQEPLQLINHLSRVGRTDKNFHFSSLPCRLARHAGVLC